jgi:tryptophan synthase beta subunit
MRIAEQCETTTGPAIDFGDVQAAAQRLRGVAHRTPVLTSRTLDAMTGARVYLKAEPFQRIGAFKFRGAYNAISALEPETRVRGVVTNSSGNHAQAVALSAQIFEIPATIVMPTLPLPRSPPHAATGRRSSSTIATRRIARPSLSASPPTSERR